MHRIFVSPEAISDDKITVSDKEKLNHIKNVLRLKAGEALLVSDNTGNIYHCQIEKIAKEIILKIKSRSFLKEKAGSALTIACAIPKQSKMDDIIDKLTQLGVDKIIPIQTQRGIVKFDKNKGSLRLERWRKLAQGAAEQSQRVRLPIVEPVKTVKEVLLEAKDYDLKLIPALFGERKSLKEALVSSKPKNIIVFIGPEGDFTDEEVNSAVKSGCVPVSLGDTVLRVDTAAVAAASFIKLYENS